MPKRTPIDPTDQWSLLTPDLTDSELAELRAFSLSLVDANRFTCDDCSLAKKCPLVFDGYNTNGDCLLDK